MPFVHVPKLDVIHHISTIGGAGDREVFVGVDIKAVLAAYLTVFPVEGFYMWVSHQPTVGDRSTSTVAPFEMTRLVTEEAYPALHLPLFGLGGLGGGLGGGLIRLGQALRIGGNDKEHAKACKQTCEDHCCWDESKT